MTSPAIPSAAATGLSREDLDALQAFAESHGRVWKSRLKALWFSGHDTGALRRLRNQLGPSGLTGLRLSVRTQPGERPAKVR